MLCTDMTAKCIKPNIMTMGWNTPPANKLSKFSIELFKVMQSYEVKLWTYICICVCYWSSHWFSDLNDDDLGKTVNQVKLRKGRIEGSWRKWRWIALKKYGLSLWIGGNEIKCIKKKVVMLYLNWAPWKYQLIMCQHGPLLRKCWHGPL